MPLKDYTTQISVFKTLGEIHEMLVKHGARQILNKYDDGGMVQSVAFVINTPIGTHAILLPANVEAVQKTLEQQKVKADRAQAERTAWRIVKDWVAAQMAILESQMVTIAQIFLPYMVSDDGEKTVYQLFEDRQLLLGGGNG